MGDDTGGPLRTQKATTRAVVFGTPSAVRAMTVAPAYLTLRGEFIVGPVRLRLTRSSVPKVTMIQRSCLDAESLFLHH